MPIAEILMKAFRLTEWQKPPRIVDVPVPEVGPGQVLVKIGGAGACHSDLHLMEWPPGMLPWKLPFTLGHEISGHVESAGPEAGDIDRSTFYVAYPWCGCGDCERCRKDEEHLCDAPRQLGINVDGGYASHCLLKEKVLLPLPDRVSFAQGAAATDAGMTSHGALMRAGELKAGQRVGIVGLGGLGMTGARIAVLMSALGLLWTTLHALWLRMEPPEGVELQREDAPALFEALERIRRKIPGPPIHHVYLDDAFNASIRQWPRFGLLGGAVNTLTSACPC